MNDWLTGGLVGLFDYLRLVGSIDVIGWLIDFCCWFIRLCEIGLLGSTDVVE